MTSVVIALQARTGSTRLPGKVLESVGRYSLLAHCVRRLQAADIGPVVVATTTLPADDAIEAEARRYGALAFRGSDTDVLARYVGVAEAFGGRYLIRATADNPAIDVDGPARLVRAVMATGAEYAVENGLPYGGAVELIASETLRRIDQLATAPGDREHVTLFVKHHLERFRASVTLAPADVRRPDLRLTVDTPADLAFMRQVLEKVDDGHDPASLSAIIAAADAVIRRAKAA